VRRLQQLGLSGYFLFGGRPRRKEMDSHGVESSLQSKRNAAFSLYRSSGTAK